MSVPEDSWLENTVYSSLNKRNEVNTIPWKAQCQVLEIGKGTTQPKKHQIESIWLNYVFRGRITRSWVTRGSRNLEHLVQEALKTLLFEILHSFSYTFFFLFPFTYLFRGVARRYVLFRAMPNELKSVVRSMQICLKTKVNNPTTSSSTSNTL